MINYTKDQKQAINDNQPGNILVSASAGSGKTRVLVDRVIKKVETSIQNNQQSKNGAGIDQLLIVTFTKAAAKEMRDRIQNALRNKIKAEQGEKKNLLIAQLRKVPVASISTFDAFCQHLIQHYYYIINLDPNFRVLNDKTEREMMRENVWDDVRENLYANDQDGTFAELTENFSGDRNDDGLMDLVYSVYDYANVNPNPEAWLDQILKMYQVSGSLTQSNFYQKHLEKVLENEIQNIILNFNSALNIAEQEDDSKDYNQLEQDVSLVNGFKDELKQASWDQLRNDFQKQANGFSRFSGSSKQADDQKELHNQAKRLRDIGKKQFKKISADFFELNEKENLAIIKQSYLMINKLIQVVKAFSTAYQDYKHRQHVLEFIDIEHDALKILSSKDEKARAIRTNLIHQFKEIMIDEYQDNNRLQDKILQLISKPNGNLFMVGDVKQSIYRFRLADPNMFMERSKKYRNPKVNSREIHLAENFRSNRRVINFINLIFEQIMDEQLGGINYYDTQNSDHPNLLKVGAKYYPDDLPTQTDVLIYDSYHNQNNQPVADNFKTNPFKIDDSSQGQIELVSQKIQQMISNHEEIYDRKSGSKRPMQYQDIAILSATRNNNLTISDIFNQYQLPVKIDDSQKYFKTTEIQIMMSLLSIIDNPYQDIPLAAVLRSPIIGMDENEMAYLRINQRSGNYFGALKYFYHHYSKDIDTSEFGNRVFDAVKEFLEQLDDFKDFSKQHELVDLIWYIYQKTGFLDYVGGMPSGKQRQANLHALYERAADYEKTSFKGLFQFVRFVKRIQEQDDDLAAAQISNTEDAISVMTIHRSKGLEFPVVFLIDASHQFNLNSVHKNFVLNDHLGLGMTYFDSKKHANVNTLQKQVIVNKENNADLSEEMRKLYVALTRAEQRLFIVGAIKNSNRSKKYSDPKDKLLDNWINQANAATKSSNDPRLAFVTRSHAKNDLDLIGPALVRHPDFIKQYSEGTDSDVLKDNSAQFKLQFYHPENILKHAPESDLEHDDSNLFSKYDPEKVDANQIKRVINFKYPDAVATHTTAYQSVSEIKRLFDDPDNLELGNFSGQLNPLKNNRYTTQDFAKPKFMQTVEAPQSTDIGTATHLVLQKIDVTKPITIKSIQNQIQQLQMNQLITPEVAQKIQPIHILKFYQSEIGKVILKHPQNLHREAPFSLLIPANQIFKNFKDKKQQVLIHGIMDGYIHLKDQVILFDYKTDYVRDINDKERIEKIIHRYRGQVNLYSIALSKILSHSVDKVYLYLLSIDRPVLLNPKN